jgi:hypothetical protein
VVASHPGALAESLMHRLQMPTEEVQSRTSTSSGGIIYTSDSDGALVPVQPPLAVLGEDLRPSQPTPSCTHMFFSPESNSRPSYGRLRDLGLFHVAQSPCRIGMWDR